MSVWTDEWDEAAQAEYVEAFEHYEAIDNALADALAAEVDRVVDLIVRSRQVAAPYLFGTQRKNLNKFPYAIVYRLIEDREVVYIASFVHQHRKPGYWRDH